MHDFARGVSCDRTPASNCAYAPHVDGEMWDKISLQLGRSVATFAVVAVLSQFMVKCACPVSG